MASIGYVKNVLEFILLEVVQHAAYAVQCVLATSSEHGRFKGYSNNELKAAKRRIYRQRQKTEEHRQILRDCIARGDIDQLPDLISAIRSGSRSVGSRSIGSSSSSAGGSSSSRSRHRASPVSSAPATKATTTGSSANSGTSRTKAIAAKKDRADNGNDDSDDDDSSTHQDQQQQPYIHKPSCVLHSVADVTCSVIETIAHTCCDTLTLTLLLFVSP
eukprot:9855-Heterococcus_DN1.PRE.4